MAEESAERRAEARRIAEDVLREVLPHQEGRWYSLLETGKLARAYLNLEEALRLSEQREAALRHYLNDAMAFVDSDAAADYPLWERALAAQQPESEDTTIPGTEREAALRQACLDALKMVNQGMWEEAMVMLSLAAQQPESEAS